MKIITFTSSTGYSGGVRQAIYQTEGLRALGHDAVLGLPHDSGVCPASVPDWWVRLPAAEKEWRGTLEGLFGPGPTVVHAFHNRAVKLAAWWGLGWLRRDVACVAHRGIITKPKNPLPYWSPGIRYFIANSRACGRSLERYCSRRKIRVMPNGVPDERVTPERSAGEMREMLGLTGQELVLGYIGNDNPVKGADVLIRAFAKACRQPGMERVRLVMVGTADPRCGAMTEAEQLTDKVRFVPYYPHVSDILQVCDVFVFPSRGMDSAPNVLLEAVRMGLPVVSTNVGGCPDIVQGNGVLVPTGNASAMADAMLAICRDEAQRRAWAAQSLIVGARYTVEARCRELEALYAGLF